MLIFVIRKVLAHSYALLFFYLSPTSSSLPPPRMIATGRCIFFYINISSSLPPTWRVRGSLPKLTRRSPWSPPIFYKSVSLIPLALRTSLPALSLFSFNPLSVIFSPLPSPRLPYPFPSSLFLTLSLLPLCSYLSRQIVSPLYHGGTRVQNERLYAHASYSRFGYFEFLFRWYPFYYPPSLLLHSPRILSHIYLKR